MASVQPRTNKDGSITYRVAFRIDRRQAQESFMDAKSAEAFKRLVERVGGASARRIRIAQEEAAELVTLGEFFERFLDPDSGVLLGVTKGTRDKYRREATWLERMGEYPLGTITKEDVVGWMNWQAAQPTRRDPEATVSSKTIKNRHAILSQVFAAAIAEKLITENPAYGLPIPKTIRGPIQFFTEATFARILEGVPEQYRPLTIFLAASGMRYGEATALTWGDFYRQGGVTMAAVTKAWQYGVNNVPELGVPKTDTSIRNVSIDDDTMRAIGTPGKPDELVFVGPQGGRMRSQTYWRHGWRKAVASVGLDPAPRIHDIRHSHASWLIARGVPLPYIQRRLGHKDIRVTVNVYGHLLPEVLLATRDAAGAAMAGVLGSETRTLAA